MKSVESITEGVDFENKTFCLPFCLLKMRRGVNVFDTPEEIIKNTYLLFFPLSQVCSIQSKMWSKKIFPDDLHPEWIIYNLCISKWDHW